jgi:transcriptional regulator with XRE-family HTH domain
VTVTRTSDEWLGTIGGYVRAARLGRGKDQVGLARDADVSLSALRNLESGRGSSLATLVKVVRALDRLDWLEQLDESAAFPTPIEQLRAARRQRPRPRRAPRRAR